MTEPSGSPPDRVNRNRKQSWIVTPLILSLIPTLAVTSCWNIAIFYFSTWRPPPCWIFKMWKF